MNEEIYSNQLKDESQNISEVTIIDSDGVTIKQVKIIQISVDEIKTREFIEYSPYKGLKKFESGDKDLFFGREQLLGELVRDLESQSLILLLGASGSGKSSVVRAGIVPWFTRKNDAKSIFTFTPGQDPFKSLYACLLTNEYSIDEDKIVENSKIDTLLEVVEKLKPKDSNWLIFIDQFEQIFTRTPEEKRKLFLKSLVRLIKQQDKSVQLILTMRADFLDKFTPYPKFGKLTEKRIRLMTDMDEHELRLAIEQPAAQHGVVFEKDLVEEIIKDVQGRAGYLPLLQYTLDILWKDEQSRGELDDRTLNINTYRTLGGVAGTLRKRVEEIYQDFCKKGLDKIVQQIFLKLVDFDKMDESGVVGKPVSRRASRSEFSEDEQIHQVIDQLISPHRLLVGDRKEKTIELAHESLLTNWDTLQSWIQEHYEVIYWRNRLVEERRRWEKTKSDEDILQGSKLVKILQLRESNAFPVLGAEELTLQDRQFIDLSRRKRDEKEKRKFMIIAAVAVIMTLATVVSSWQWLSAEKSKIDSLVQTAKTELNSQNYFDALKVSLRLGNNLRNPIQRFVFRNSDEDLKAKISFIKALYNIKEYNRFNNAHPGGINAVKFHPKTNTLVSTGEDGIIKLWNIYTGDYEVLVNTQKTVYRDIIFSLNGRILAAINTDGWSNRTIFLDLWNWDSKIFIDFTYNHNNINSKEKLGVILDVFISSENKRLATLHKVFPSIYDKQLDGISLDYLKYYQQEGKFYQEFCWWKIDNNNSLQEQDCRQIPEKFFELKGIIDADNNLFLASIEQDKQYVDRVWKLDKDSTSASSAINFNPYFKSSDLNKYLCYLPRNKKIIGLNFSSQIIVVPLDSQSNTIDLMNFQDIYDSIHCLEDEQSVVEINKKNIKLYNIGNSYSFPRVFTGHKDIVTSVTIDSSHQVLASGSRDETIRIWSLANSNYFKLLDIPDIDHGYQILDVREDYLAYRDGERIKIWNLKEKIFNLISPEIQKMLLENIKPDSTLQNIHLIDNRLFFWGYDVNGELKLNLVNRDTKKIKIQTPDCIFNDQEENKNISSVSYVAINSEGETLAMVDRNTIYLWDINAEECTQQKLELSRREANVRYNYTSISSLDFNSQENLLAAGNQDGIIDVWDIRQEKSKYLLPGHRERVIDVSFSPNNNLLASIGSDETTEIGHTIKFWNIKTGDLIEILKLERDATHITFNSDGKSLIVMTYKNTIMEFNLTWDKLIEQGCDWMKDYIKTHPEEKELNKICRHTLSKLG